MPDGQLKLLELLLYRQNSALCGLATRNLRTILAGILIFCCVFGSEPVRAGLSVRAARKELVARRTVLEFNYGNSVLYGIKSRARRLIG